MDSATKQDVEPMSELRRLSWTVFGIFVVMVLVLTVGLSIGGSIYLGNQALNKATASQQQLADREEQSAIRTAIPTCHALLLMDNASHPPVTNASDSPDSYGHKLARAIHTVYLSTDCTIILQHKPISVIEKELQQKQH